MNSTPSLEPVRLHGSNVRIGWLVAFMWGAYFLNYCDRQAVFAMFESLKQDLRMTDLQLGLTGSYFLWVYGVGCPVAGYLADRVSKRVLVVASLILWSGVTIATGLATSPTMLLALRALMGVSEALYMPAAIALTANASPPHLRSRAVAILTTAQIAGTIGGSWFGGWMSEMGMWRYAFFALGAAGIVYSIPYALFLQRLEVSNAVSSQNLESGSSWRGLVQSPSFLFLCVVFPVFVFGLWMLYSWLPNYLQTKFQLGPADAALMATATVQPATLLGLSCGGFLADAWVQRNLAARWWLLAISMLACAPCLHAIGQLDSAWPTSIAMIGFGMFSGFMIGNIFPAAFDVLPSGLRASAVGVLNFFGAALSGFAPMVVGRWKETVGIERMFTFTALAYTLGGILILFVIRYRYDRDRQKLPSSP